MCGFAGILNKTPETADAVILRQMASTISYRGPDEEGIYIDGSLGFFHKRLSIIDLSTGQQPMSYGDCTIVYNGEIYNYIELRQGLIEKGHSFSTTSDTEVILQLYKKYNSECVNMLNGMFAFVIYDKSNRKLFFARDHFGIKPLYWYNDNSRLIFASEIKALLAHPDIRAEANIDYVHEYLTFQFILGEGTMFRNIFKLMPGHFMSYCMDSGSLQITRYWEPNFKIDPYHTEEYFIVELRRIIVDAIRQQLRSDVPLGTYLSGGIDSTLVTILASKFQTNGIRAFTGVFDEEPGFSELKYARIAAGAAKAELMEVYPSEQEFIDLLPRLIYHLDEPVGGPGLFPQYIVSRHAAKYVKVVLGGQGGDEIFGGYTRYLVAYLEQALKGAIYETNEEREHIVSLISILPNLPSLKQYVPMMKNFWGDGAFDPMDQRYYRLLNRMGDSIDYFDHDFIKSRNEEEIFSRFMASFNNSDTKSYYNKMTHFDMYGSLPGLLQVEDRMSMACSIESRVPLLDRRIVDLISVMPAGMKFMGGELKYLLKKTMKDVIPAEILSRKDKMGFPVPLHIWSKNKAKDFILDVLLSKKSKERNIINTKYLKKLVDNEQPFGRGLWGILCLEIWFNQFIDN
jgi:asparagine synthase (glutamine-hydrolysing)